MFFVTVWVSLGIGETWSSLFLDAQFRIENNEGSHANDNHGTGTPF
jgi:hypothetical protein